MYGRHLPDVLGDSQVDYRCIVNVDGNKQTTRGVRVSDYISCQARKVNLTAPPQPPSEKRSSKASSKTVGRIIVNPR